MARAGKEALLLVSGIVPLLLAAAVLEAGVARAPDWYVSGGVKLGAAGVVGLLFVAYICLGGWRPDLLPSPLWGSPPVILSARRLPHNG